MGFESASTVSSPDFTSPVVNLRFIEYYVNWVFPFCSGNLMFSCCHYLSHLSYVLLTHCHADLHRTWFSCFVFEHNESLDDESTLYAVSIFYCSIISTHWSLSITILILNPTLHKKLSSSLQHLNVCVWQSQVLRKGTGCIIRSGRGSDEPEREVEVTKNI